MKKRTKVFSTSDVKEESKVIGISISMRELMGMTSLSVPNQKWNSMSSEEKKGYNEKRKEMVSNMSKLRKSKKKGLEKFAEKEVNKVFAKSKEMFN